ncbi:hypothetical protein BGX23_008412 [Mortierella sp. AD031]|nr:hypothetical protein BGX23_008412 [Mortierella sp. AD031]
MDPLSKLPIECLQLILHVLALGDKAGSLAALLCTNKYIASVTLPYLYIDPYQRPFHIAENQGSVYLYPSGHSLTRMLLAQAAVNTLPQALAVAMRLDTPATTGLPRPIDYFAHIRHLNLERWAVDIDRIWPKNNTRPEILAFALGETFEHQCQLDRLLPEYRWEFTKTDILRHHYHVMLYQETSWCLAFPILEQLESMTMPISAVGRYLAVVERLQRVESIRLITDDVLDYDSAFSRDEEAMAVLHATRNRQLGVLRTLALFVREHTTLFKGTLKSITMADGDFWPYTSQVSPEGTFLEILRLLPPLSKVSALTDDNWLHFMAHHLTTDLQHVDSINIKHNTPDRWVETIWKHPSFLQRCRALVRLKMVSPGQGSFNWAVQEKQDMKGVRHCNNIMGESDIRHAAETRTAFPQHSLIPLAHASITEGSTPFKDEVDDIAYAFSQTLRSLAVMASDSFGDPARRIHIGKGWVDLPLLTRLEFGVHRARLVIDSRFLSHCPNAEYVFLMDRTLEYRCQEIVPTQSACLPRIQTLILAGWSALTFHPATLNSTKSLTFLFLTVCETPGSVCFIPPVEELERSYGIQSNSEAEPATIDSEPQIIRPLWTWDWDLPRLTNLRLEAEFAYRFEFRMLEGCPALVFLDLDICTADGQHMRVIEEADMFVAAAAGVAGRARKRIVAPSVRKLAVYGNWWIEDSLLEGFLMDMFPNLEMLMEKKWKGVTLEGLLNVIRKRPDNKLNLVYMDLPLPSEVEMSRHRFYPVERVKGRALD